MILRACLKTSVLRPWPQPKSLIADPLRILKQTLMAVTIAALLGFGALPIQAMKLADLKADKNLTPERLIKYFADFEFNLGREVRQPDLFLEKKAGDCDDFATLAADLLRERGYTTRLVVVYMPKDVHVVCYVAEVNGYLDYNRRKHSSPLIKCGAELTEVAKSVAASFKTDWRTVSEFDFRNGTRNFLATEFR